MLTTPIYRRLSDTYILSGLPVCALVRLEVLYDQTPVTTYHSGVPAGLPITSFPTSSFLFLVLVGLPNFSGSERSQHGSLPLSLEITLWDPGYCGL